MADLRMGAAILKDAIDLDAEKQDRLDRGRREEKAAAAATATNVRRFTWSYVCRINRCHSDQTCLLGRS